MTLKPALLATTLLSVGLLGWAVWGARLAPRTDSQKNTSASVHLPLNTERRPPTASAPVTRTAQTSSLRPNFVVVVLDDGDFAMLHDTDWQAEFPNIARLARNGIAFTNCHVTTPKCCPSRASFFRGQYASKLGVTGNNSDPHISNGFPGGYLPYRERGYDRDDLPVWLRESGYRTMLVGKYLHNDFDYEVPPGWDDFYYSLGNVYFGTSRFTTATDPLGSRSRLADAEYRTRIESRDACKLIDAHLQATADAAQPFFLYLAPLAPHDPASGRPRVESRYADIGTVRPRSQSENFNEADFADKPSELQRIALLDAESQGALAALHRERVLSVKSVDDLVGDVVQTLGKHELLDETYIFFTSDHGYLLGEHRVIGKGVPYQEASRVPLFVSGPGVAAGVTSDHLLAHFDVTATMLELAEVPRPEFLDAKSFVPLLAQPHAIPADQWRHSVLLEHWESSNFPGGRIDTAYIALRTYSESYVEWAQGETEYYDLLADPDQLENRILDVPASAREFLSGMMRIHREDNRAPFATTAGAFGGDQPTIPANSQIFGYADDDTGVQRVRIVVWDPSTGTFWNGTRWQLQYTQLVPEVTRENGLLTRWQYRLNLANQLQVPLARVLVAARSVGLDGKVSASAPATAFTIDAAPPETTLNRPQPNDVLGNPARIHGNSSDNVQVSRVQLTIRNLDDQRYWNGADWQATRAVIDQRVATTGRWHYFPTLPPGRYGVWVRAFDSAGNYDLTPASAVFTVK